MQVSSLSSTSYMQQLQSLFTKADKNSDGGISLDEFTASATDKSAGSAKSAESDKTAKLFGKMDSDGNGNLTQDEMSAFVTKLSASAQNVMMAYQQQGSGSQADALLSTADTDGDGKVSAEEFAAAAPDADEAGSAERSQELFGKIDSNGDGSLTSDELTAFDDKMKSGVSMPFPPPSDTDSSDDQGTTLADILQQANDSSTSKTSQSGGSDLAKQIEAYMQRMMSGYADQVANATSELASA